MKLQKTITVPKVGTLVRHTSLRWTIVAGCMILVIGSGSATAMAFNSPLRTSVFQKVAIVLHEQPHKPTVHTVVSPAEPAKAIATTPPPKLTSNTTPASTTAPVIRYKTSPDPYSDAWSPTPPGPGPSDINITVTAPGQVKPGTKIVYSAVKEDTVYYGGDMVFDTPTVIFHKGGSLYAPLTISTPDGLAMVEPSDPWYDTNPSAWVTTNAPVPAGTTMPSWTINLAVNPVLPIGTHQQHISAWRAGGTGTLEWEYDGFITIDIEN